MNLAHQLVAADEAVELSDRPRPSRAGREQSAERVVTLYRVGALVRQGRRHLCLVKRCSPLEACIRAFETLRSGEALKLELKGQAAIPATVADVGHGDTLVRFDRPVDVLALLRTGPEDPLPRMPRIIVSAPVTLREGADVQRATLVNISQGGISARCDRSFAVGSEVIVTLPGLGPRAGVVRWNGPLGCGITFNAAVGLTSLIDWLKTHAPEGA